jgi:hypothetical protein
VVRHYPRGYVVDLKKRIDEGNMDLEQVGMHGFDIAEGEDGDGIGDDVDVDSD